MARILIIIQTGACNVWPLFIDVVDQGVFDIFTQIQTYTLKWTVKDLTKKLDRPMRLGKVDSEAFQIKGPVWNWATLAMSLATEVSEKSNVSGLYLRPYLVKRSVTGTQEIIICWSVTIESSKQKGYNIKFSSQKDIISVESSKFRHGKSLSFSDIGVYQDHIHHINLHMEVIWPKKNDMLEVCTKKARKITGMKHMMTSGKYADIELVCQGKKFSCHKVVLAAQSPVFDRMFANECNLETKQGLVEIQDMDSKQLEAFLMFAYTGKIDDAMKKHAKSLLAAGDKYDIQDLMLLAEQELVEATNPENAIDMLLLSNLHGVDKLKRKSLKVIITNFDAISKQPKWKELKEDNCDIVTLVEVSAETLAM